MLLQNWKQFTEKMSNNELMSKPVECLIFLIIKSNYFLK